MPSLPSPFCSNDSRTLSALRATVRKRFTADAILIRKNSDSQNTPGKGRGSEGSKKKWGSSGPSPPIPRLRWPRRLRREGHIQVFYAFDSTKSCGDRRHCIKTQTFANVFRHHCSRADIYKSGQKWFKVVIRNFRDSSLYECQSLIFSHLSCIRHPVCDASFGHK